MSVRALLRSGDRLRYLQNLGDFDFTLLVRDLRQVVQDARAIAEHVEPATLAVSSLIGELRNLVTDVGDLVVELERAARLLLDRWSENRFARAAALAALADCGHEVEVAHLLATRFNNETGEIAELRIAARILRRGGGRTSGRWIFDLADLLEETHQSPSPEVLHAIAERLLGRWLAHDDPRSAADQSAADGLVLELKGKVDIPGEPGLTVRQLTSRQQLDRWSHHLRNCASTYLDLVRTGASRLFGVELDGTPVELIEVHPCSGRIVQWKGTRNTDPDTVRRPKVTRVLVALQLIRAQ